MPIYEYRCTICGERFERLRPMSGVAEDSPPPCPACASNETRRAVAGFAVHGPAGADPQEITAQRAQEQRMASVTSKETIDKLRSAKKKGG
jgi:putative FmdB family regulatory protein